MSLLLTTVNTITVTELIDTTNAPAIFTHPVVNEDLLEKWVPDEIRTATSLQTAITNGDCVVTYNGNPVSDISLFGLSTGFDSANGLATQTFFAEESGAVAPSVNGGFQWSYGNGDETPQNSGMPATISGTIVTLGLELEGGSASGTVQLYINGTATGSSVTVTAGSGSATIDINQAISKGDVVNFRTTAAANALSGRVTAYLQGGVPSTGEVITGGAIDGQVPVYNAVSGQFEPTTLATTPAAVADVAAGSTLGLEQSLLAKDGQPGLTVLAVGFTTTGKVQGTSLGAGNVIEVYANGADFTAGTVLYREFMSLGEVICFTGLTDGAIITSTQGFYGFSDQVDGGDISPMPLLSLGLSFKSTFFFAFRNSQSYNPGGTGNNQGWVHVVNGPIASTIEMTDGNGNVVQGQTGIELDPWEYHRLYTSGNQEYILNSTNSIMACHNANMDLNPFGRFFDSRLIMPLTNDGITWPRSGRLSAPYDNTVVDWYVRDGASGSLNNGNGVSPGSPNDFDAAPPIGTGANDADYEPNGATRVLATGLISAYSGADSAGLEASPLMPTSGMSQVVAQPLFIADNGDGGNSGVAIASPYEGTARVYEWDAFANDLVLAYTVPLTRTFTPTTRDQQNHPAAGLISNDAQATNTLIGQLNAGIIIADVPITVVVQNGDGNLQPTVRSQNGTTTTSIRCNDDETLSLGITPDTLKAEIREGTDELLYRRVIGVGGIDTWTLA